jgi:uncharacterized alkaline shock family protein YloU
MTFVVESEFGTVTVPDGVLVGIAVRAAERVEGIRVRRRRTVDLDEGEVRLAVAARRGEPLLDLATQAQEQVASALREMCGIDVRVEIAIGELE